MTDTQSKTAGSAEAVIESLRFWVEPAREYGASTEVVDWEEAQKAIRATLSHPATQAGALQAVEWQQTARTVVDVFRSGQVKNFKDAHAVAVGLLADALAATQPNAAPAAEVVADKPEPYPPENVEVDGKRYTVYFNKGGYVRGVEVHVMRSSGGVVARRLIARDGPAALAAIAKTTLAAPAAAIDAREQEARVNRFILDYVLTRLEDKAKLELQDLLSMNVYAPKGFEEWAEERGKINIRDRWADGSYVSTNATLASEAWSAALASPSEAPAARPNAAGQEQGEASAGLVLIGWEYRHLDTANTPNRWSEWERCRARNRHTSTDEDFVKEILSYIKSGFNYEVRELYAATPPLEAVGPSGMTADQAQGEKS